MDLHSETNIYNMKFFKNISLMALVLSVLIVLIQCTSIPKLEKEAPTTFKAVYYQDWNAGIKEGGSGTNVYFELNDSSIVLDSIFFRSKVTELQRMPNSNLVYIGRFKFQKEDILNGVNEPTNWPFKIDDNDCIVSYSEDNKVHYFKISNIKGREPINYPGSPSTNRD